MAYSLSIVTMVTMITAFRQLRCSRPHLTRSRVSPNSIIDCTTLRSTNTFNRDRIKFRRKNLPLIDFKHAEDGPPSPTPSDFLSWRCEKKKSLINNSRSASQDVPNTKQCQLPYSVVRPQQVTALPAPCYFNTRFSLNRQLYSYEEK
jgi:hypothetical protein